MNKNATKFSKAIARTLTDLAARWQDEKGYEDIAEYQKVLQTEATKFGITLTGMTSRPFGCIFIDGEYKYTVQVKLQQRRATITMSWVKV